MYSLRKILLYQKSNSCHVISLTSDADIIVHFPTHGGFSFVSSAIVSHHAAVSQFVSNMPLHKLLIINAHFS